MEKNKIGNYLYILPFNNSEHFKIGISSVNMNRIYKHDSTYSINVDNVMLYEGDRDIIKSLERTLLSLSPKVNNLYHI